MKNYQRLKGMVAATFTPFNTDGELNLPIISQYADQMATSQMAGVFVCGTTGESLSLTVEERKAVLEAWVKATKRRFKVIAHVGTNSIHEGVELAKHAQECGADAVGAMAPSFFKPLTVKDLIAFFAPLFKARQSFISIRLLCVNLVPTRLDITFFPSMRKSATDRDTPVIEGML